MVECICCKKREANIRVEANVIFHICGQTDCRSKKHGLTVGEWLISEDAYHFVQGNDPIILIINDKKYQITNDKRVIKGLANKIKEIIIKQSGN